MRSFEEVLKDESIQTKIRVKYHIALQLAQIMLTIHNLSKIKWLGHLSSHNVFIDLKKTGSASFSLKIRIAELELFDIMQYSNMFFNYRIASVWSSPEVLAVPKKLPKEITP